MLSIASDAPSIVPTVAPSSVRSSANNINTIIGTGTAGSSPAGSPATATNIQGPRSVVADSIGNLYFVDNVCVRKISLSVGIVMDVAGVCGTTGSSGDGGPSTSAKFMSIIGLAVDSVGQAYIGDNSNDRVRMSSANGIMSLVAGSGSVIGNNGPATSALVDGPIGIWIVTNSLLYIAGNAEHRVRMVNANIISTVVGKSCQLVHIFF